MDLPSTRGFNNKTLTIPSEWLKLKPVERVETMECWAIENLQPRQAVTGVYQIEEGKFAHEPIVGSCWILRHNDYDTGRANVEIQIREVFRGKTHIWHARHDELTEGYLADYVERAMYLRGRDRTRNQLVWERHYSLTQKYENPIKRQPAVRVSELWRQCWFIDLELSTWLHSNVAFLHRQEIGKPVPMPVYHQDALYCLSGCSLFWLAENPTEYDALREKLHTAKKPSKPMYEEMTLFRLHRQDELRKRNRLAGPEHYVLYDRLKQSLDFVRQNPVAPSRPINAAALLRLQQRWVNVYRKHMQAFA